MPTVQELLEYYLNLLIIQYKEKPKMRATLSALVAEAIMENLAFMVRDGFDIETATGKQLDIIGKYVGVDRFYSGQEFNEEYFGLVSYGNETPNMQVGFSTYADFETKVGRTLQYFEIVGGGLQLSDEDYRVILKLKIIQNNINHSHKEIDESLVAFFGNTVRADSQGDMTMIYFVPKDLTAIVKVAIEKEVLPKPMGVELQYLIPTDKELFGFANYSGTPSSFTKGFSTYSTFDTADGGVLTYNKLVEA